MRRYDAIVVGGGLLGCFALRSLARYRVKAALFERREDLCTGISRANSAIVYSGCDTKPGTLKTELCVRAARNFQRLCDELGVRYARRGSVMVSFGPNGDEVLRKKCEQGQENGVRDVRLLSQPEVLEMEPIVKHTATLGLYVPDTGTVNPWELCLAAAENALTNGMELRLNTEVTGITPISGGYIVETGDEEFFARGVVNCAGLNADVVYEMVREPKIRIAPTAGDYLVLDTKALGCLRHILFHEPETRNKGLTLVPTVDGNILIGALERKPNDDEAFSTSHEGLERLYALIDEVVPSLPVKHVIRNFGAVRPNPYWVTRNSNGECVPESRSIHEFCILSPKESPGFYSMIGMKTPGLTCAHELGTLAADHMAHVLSLTANRDVNLNRIKPVRVHELSYEERKKHIEQEPAYGKVVCRCREVTEGEIKNAMSVNPQAITLDGVKLRTGAMGGRCQGSYCTHRILEILAYETDEKPENIRKNVPGSAVVFGCAANTKQSVLDLGNQHERV